MPAKAENYIRTTLMEGHNRIQRDKIIAYVGNDKNRMKELIDIFLNEEYRLVQRAAWPVGVLGEKEPELIQPYLPSFLSYLEKGNIHDAVKRNIFRIMQFVFIPKELQGRILDTAFSYLLNRSEAVAIRVFAMQVIFNIAQNEPDLLQELKAVIEEEIPHAKPAYLSRGRKILRKCGIGQEIV